MSNNSVPSTLPTSGLLTHQCHHDQLLTDSLRCPAVKPQTSTTTSSNTYPCLTTFSGGSSGGEDLVCSQAGREGGLSGYGVEELRRAGEYEAEQDDAGDVCRQADKDISIGARAETQKHKILLISKKTGERHYAVTIWDMIIYHRSGGETR